MDCVLNKTTLVQFKISFTDIMDLSDTKVGHMLFVEKLVQVAFDII